MFHGSNMSGLLSDQVSLFLVPASSGADELSSLIVVGLLGLISLDDDESHSSSGVDQLLVKSDKLLLKRFSKLIVGSNCIGLINLVILDGGSHASFDGLHFFNNLLEGSRVESCRELGKSENWVRATEGLDLL